MPPLPADFIHARACKLKCEKILTRPSDPPNRYSRVSGCIGSAGARGKRRKPRKGRSPLDGAQRRKNGGLLHLAIRRSASQSALLYMAVRPCIEVRPLGTKGFSATSS